MFRLFVCAILLAAALPAQNLMPWPSKLTRGEGYLAIPQSFSVSFADYQERRLQAAGTRLAALIAAQTGRPQTEAVPLLEVRCERASAPVQKLGEDESYRLSVTATGAKLQAATPLGALRGMATFAQLVEPGPDGYRAPVVEIEDAPRFPWRGLLIDVSRHWMPVEVILRNLDAMALVKMNVLHWHLSDDQGFRVESKRYPKLHQLGSDGHYYTQQQIREIVAYARERGIRVVPEFDIPGHSTSWLVGYPELGSAPGPYRIERKWGIKDPALDPSNEAVYTFMAGFLGEMAALFPDRYFHIGGDEVNGKHWKASDRIQKFMKQKGLATEHDLQAYFNKRIQPILTRNGKIMMGWDEILHKDLPRDIVIHSWRGQKSLAEAARLGFSGILSNGYYLDLMQHTDRHYAVDPLEKETAGLTDEERKRVLGGEACEWAEYVTPENIDARIWPRNAAIAERLWSPQSVRDVDSMYERMAVVSRQLEWAGAAHRRSWDQMLARIAGAGPIEPVRTLAEVVEPVKNYQRNSLQKGAYTQSTPLNRMVDVAHPDSMAARDFEKLVAKLAADKSVAPAIRLRLQVWRTNHARLQPASSPSALLKETATISQNLTAVSAAGLEALARIEKGQRGDAAWYDRQQALFKEAAKPSAELLLSVLPGVRQLVEMAK
jgi:hexosaminidase